MDCYRSVSAREVYLKTRKVRDLFWNSYVCRPLAAVVVDALKNTRVTPDQVTLVSVAVAVVAALILIGVPGTAGLLAGVLVYQFSYVLDCVDGMLARWRGTASSVGHLLDFLMDELKAFLILTAVTLRLFSESEDPRFLMLGLLGLLALASGIALTTFLRRPELAQPTRAPEAALGLPDPTPVQRARAWIQKLVVGTGKFLVHYPSYILYAALLGRIELYFFPYILVNLVYAMGAFAFVARRFARPSLKPAVDA